MALHRIEIRTAQGSSVVSVEQFLALTLDARVKLLLERSVRFFDENGELSAKEGMRLLREAKPGAVLPAPHALMPATLLFKEFIALPLDERLRIVMDRRVRLVDEHGADVTLKDALRIARGQ